VREVTGELLPSAAEADLQRCMEGLESLQDTILANLSKEEMVDVLNLNGVDPKSLDIHTNTVDMCCLISDGMAHGLPSDCPVCHGSSLVECHGRLSCWGYLAGMTKCAYKSSSGDCQRFKFMLPPALEGAEWVREWRAQWAADHGGEGGATSSSSSSSSSGAAAEVAAVEAPDVCSEQAEAEAMTSAALKKALKVTLDGYSAHVL
jgi:hypothetical protein